MNHANHANKLFVLPAGESGTLEEDDDDDDDDVGDDDGTAALRHRTTRLDTANSERQTSSKTSTLAWAPASMQASRTVVVAVEPGWRHVHSSREPVSTQCAAASSAGSHASQRVVTRQPSRLSAAQSDKSMSQSSSVIISPQHKE